MLSALPLRRIPSIRFRCVILQPSAAGAIIFAEDFMKNRITLMAAATALLATALPATAQNYGPQRDPNGYYSQSDQRGYYDRNGQYRHMRAQNGWRGDQDDRRG